MLVLPKRKDFNKVLHGKGLQWSYWTIEWKGIKYYGATQKQIKYEIELDYKLTKIRDNRIKELT